MKVTVNSDLIRKRLTSLNSTCASSDAQFYYERAKREDKEDSSLRLSSMKEFMSRCSDKVNANKYYRQCLYVLERVAMEEKGKSITETFCNNVLPYIENVATVSDIVGRYRLTHEQSSMIKNTAEQYATADRIITNHNQMSKRFNIESRFNPRNDGKFNLSKAVLECCEMIDTYDINPAEKLALTLEEVLYCAQKNDPKCDTSSVVNAVIKYYLHRENTISEKQYSNYRAVLQESPVLSDTDVKSVSYFVESYDDNPNKILQILNRFAVQPIKDVDELRNAIGSIFVLCNTIEIANNMSAILTYISDYLVLSSDAFSIEEIMSACIEIPKRIEKSVMENDDFTRDLLATIIEAYNAESNKLITAINTREADDSEKVIKYKTFIDACSKKLCELYDMVYSSYNINTMSTIKSESATAAVLGLAAYKTIKFSSFLNTCKKIDKKLAAKGKNLITTMKDKIKEIRGLSLAEDTIFSCLTQDGIIDGCVGSFYISEGADINKLHEMATSICKEINKFDVEDKMHCYYRITDMLEFHVVDCSARIELTETQSELIKLPYNDIYRYCRITEMEEFLTAYGKAYSRAARINESLDKERMDLLYEACGYLNGTYPFKLPKLGMIAESVIVQPEVPLSVMTEAAWVICSILESDEEKEKIREKNEKKEEENKPKKKSILDKIKSVGKDKDNNDNENSDEKDQSEGDEEGKEKKIKNPLAGVNLNSIKLYLTGLKSKVKNMSTKEKEISKNMDITFNHFASNVKNALVSDRREAIIKGSVIPSFSKSIKLMIAAAGLTAISPPVGIISVIGGLAVSKNLTKKERVLLLDEIETELEVIDKEINLAESRNQMKRYRTLLKTKKDLQRQYQRIRYNIRVGKDILPDSTMGVKQSD